VATLVALLDVLPNVAVLTEARNKVTLILESMTIADSAAVVDISGIYLVNGSLVGAVKVNCGNRVTLKPKKRIFARIVGNCKALLSRHTRDGQRDT
jgi:hypothetical protein